MQIFYHLTSQNPTLSILTYHFTINPTSNILFFFLQLHLNNIIFILPLCLSLSLMKPTTFFLVQATPVTATPMASHY